MQNPFVVALLIGMTTAVAQAQRPAPAAANNEYAAGILREPRPIAKAIEIINQRSHGNAEPKDGFSFTLGDMITGAGFIAGGPAYRHHVFGGRAVVKASGALSVRLYTQAQVGIDWRPLLGNRLKVGATSLFQDALQVNYFGLGLDSSPLDRSGYRLTTNDVTTYARFGGPRVAVSTRVGWLQPIAISTMAGRRPKYPDTVLTFTDDTAPGLTNPASFLHSDTTLSLDTRDSSGHPTDGGLYRATVSVFSDRSGNASSFQRYEAEAAHFWSIEPMNWTLALRGWMAGTHQPEGDRVPFYLTANLGGRNARGYPDYRFHDRSMHAYSVESRWAIFRHLDAAVFADLGSVAPSTRRLSLSNLKRSYGAGVRLHNDRWTISRVDVAHGDEGWHVMFKMNDPFQRSSQTEDLQTVIPFNP